MPPLLPEYLSQPIQVIVQSLPEPTEWPVWLSSELATLIGSFGGALIGGLVAYLGTLRAHSKTLKREKGEQILVGIEQCVAQIKNCDHYRGQNTINSSMAFDDYYPKHDLEAQVDKAIKVSTEFIALTNLYFRSHSSQVSAVSDSLQEWRKNFINSLGKWESDSPRAQLISMPTPLARDRFKEARKKAIDSLNKLALDIRNALS
ncbi:hypothetical protein Q8G38_00065 [Halomonas venusta]|uniref:hypothetical protein n=1 Tax=Vreelandella venusta TaxID=44935 RepID=UPI00295F2729|nr:hypothetical protein [Halomonas venusta]MDW0357703.1 hypothetical protein [Halomonas venusta]